MSRTQMGFFVDSVYVDSIYVNSTLEQQYEKNVAMFTSNIEK